MTDDHRAQIEAMEQDLANAMHAWRQALIREEETSRVYLQRRDALIALKARLMQEEAKANG